MEGIEFIINILASVIAVEYMDRGFEKKYAGIKRWISFVLGCGVYFFVLTIINRHTNFEGIFCIAYGIALLLYGLTALEGNIYDKAMVSFVWVVIVLLGTFSVYGIWGFISEKDMQSLLTEKGYIYVCAALLASLVKFFMGRTVLIIHGKKDRMDGTKNRMVGVAFAIILLTGLGMFWLELEATEGKQRYGIITSLLAGEYMGVLLLEKINRKMAEYQKEKMELEFRIEQEKLQSQNRMDIYRIGREINHWRHDMNGKLEVLYRLQKKKRFEEVEKYIEALCQELKQYPELPQETGNEGLNAALMKAIPRCKDENIRFCYVVIGRPDKIDSMDLGNLMCNLFDNGIEACLEMENERMIEVAIYSNSDQTEIRMENTIFKSVIGGNPNLRSHKKNGDLHGFGVESIQKIIYKYTGQYTYWEENHLFVQEIILRSSEFF